MSNQTPINYPLIQEIPYSDPLSIFARFAQDTGALFLDSAQTGNITGNYSFIAIDPFLILTGKNGKITLGNSMMEGDPFFILQTTLRAFPLATHPNLPLFQGGVAGYFAYDLCHHLERIPRHIIDDLKFPDMILGFYDLVIAFDHQQHRTWIFSSGYPELDPNLRHVRAITRSEQFINKLAEPPCESSPKTIENNFDIQANFTKQNYQQMVQRVIDYIYAGDIFQANVTQRYCTPLPPNFPRFRLYQHLREINPAPFAAYLNFFNTTIASASPERFLKMHQGTVETRPIKGTRPRGKTPQEDNIFAQELLNSSKDKAENTMIVDLMRNDLSRVCYDHSVQVTQLCKLESYATVHHLVSCVVGKLKPDFDAVDLIRATFPGGSVTGAPKIRAMEIIAELEPTARGPYCGSIGYIGFNGCMDLSITIRSYTMIDNALAFQTGGGIVADSLPLEEYQEMQTKAAALQKALT